MNQSLGSKRQDAGRDSTPGFDVGADKTVDVVELRSELTKALHDGATTSVSSFHKSVVITPLRTAEPAQRPDLIDRQWFKDKVTGALFEMGWQIDSKPTFIRAVDRANQPATPSPQQIADMCRGAERLRQSA